MTDDKTKNRDHFTEPNGDPGRRYGHYGLTEHKVDFVLILNEGEFTEEDQDAMAGMMCRAAMGFIGNKEHEDLAVQAVNRTQFVFDRPRVPERVVKMVQETLHWAFAFVFGHQEYAKDYLAGGGMRDDEWEEKYGKTVVFDRGRPEGGGGCDG